MRRRTPAVFSGAALMLLASAVGAADQAWRPLQNEAAIQFAGEVEREFAAAKSLDSAAQRRSRVRLLAEKVRTRFPENVLLERKLAVALDGADEDALAQALREAIDTIQFRFKQEADLPADFPEPTPVGEIRLKQYPAYRLARVSSNKDSAFFTLFAHITTNRIEMTAPVEMNYQAKKDQAKPEQVDMAFLYGKPTLGKLGKTLLGVDVQDVPARETVSLGLKGDVERSKVADYEQLLAAWLEKQAPEYERAGMLRVMGYNSPQVPAGQRYYEVELPVKRK